MVLQESLDKLPMSPTPAVVRGKGARGLQSVFPPPQDKIKWVLPTYAYQYEPER